MRGLTIRTGLAAVAIAAAALGSAANVAAAPMGPCQNVTYVGVCEPLREQTRTPSQQGMADTAIPGGSIGIGAVN
jgi:hypothetical protein